MKGEVQFDSNAISEILIQEKVLRLIGVWPLTAQNRVAIGQWTISVIIQVYRHCLDADDTMDAFLFDLSSIVSISKLFIIRFNRQHTYVLVNSLIQDWSTTSDFQRRQIMMKYLKKSRIVSFMILYLGYASAASFVFKALPLETLLPTKISGSNSVDTFNNDNKTFVTTTYFLAAYCTFGTLPVFQHGLVLALQIAQILVNAISHCGNDGFFFSLVMHLCGQLEILKMDFAHMETEGQACRRKFNMLIKRHCKLVGLANNLEEAFNMVILVQLLMSTLLLCIEGFQMLIALNMNDNTAATKHAILIITMLVQVYLYAYAGDVLESRTGEIALAAYNSPWHDFPTDVAKDISLVILRSSEPSQVTAGKFLSMNLFTFKEILKASASYLSVLRVMMDV